MSADDFPPGILIEAKCDHPPVDVERVGMRTTARCQGVVLVTAELGSDGLWVVWTDEGHLIADNKEHARWAFDLACEMALHGCDA